ncbi:radical SAM/SPASM domain-containing protein [Stappia stellulata]|uniref:radical SAM/SPASM domain-containing protein n=1 Tax=Stappia stellulata TaxID=71235 RepID=UPI000428BC56|nr:radical SAM/SPASM domain-containing protein [Stappia stellulata]
MTAHTPRTESSAIDGSPVWLWLDPTTRCNLACRLCYTKLSHGKDDMTPEDLRRMLSDLRDSGSVDVQTIHLNWRGEPLMNPRFAELLATVGDVMPDVPLQWHTNGTMLTEKRVEEIVSVDFDHKIFVSLDGGNRLSHDLNRGEGNFEKSLRGLEVLLDRAKDRPGLRVGVYQIDLDEPIEDYDPRFLKLLERVDQYEKVKPLLPGGAEQAIDKIENLESDGTLDRMLSEEVLPHLPVPQLPCFWAGHVFCVAPNGDVSICVISHGQAGIVGNLLRDGVDRVLAGALAFRCRLADHGRGAVSHCKDCRKPAGRIFPQHIQDKRAAAA